MLEALRRGAGSLIAKIFIFLLVASFAVWGVADIFRGADDTAVARVGDTEVSIQRFQQALREEIQAISRQSGTYLTMDQVRALGIDNRVLQRLMAEAALDDEADRRNLQVPDAVVADAIREDPAFKAPGGQFDRSYFNQYLQATGYSEAGFVAQQRRRMLRRAIGEAVGGAPQAPETLASAFNRFINEARSVRYVVVAPEQAGEVVAPTDAEVKAYFDEHAAEFTAPEYRTAALLVASPAEIAAGIEVSDEDLRAAYDARAAGLSTPERRTIEQIAFNDAAAAQAAYEAIQNGKDFKAIAEERGLSDQDISLGTLSRDEVVDPAVAEAAFGLSEGEVGAPVDGQFSPVLVRVTEIQEGDAPTFEEMAPEIRQAVAVERARDQVLDYYDGVEDDRAAGMTLKEIAEARGLPYREVTVDQGGRAPDGTEVELPQAADLLSGIFETDVGIETDPIETDGEGFVWYSLRETTPARQLSFDEAQDAAAAALTRERQQEAVRERTDELVARIKEGETLDAVAAELGTGVLSLGPVRRSQEAGGFGQAALGLVFTTPEGEVGETVAADPTQRVIFRVTDVTVPPYEPQDTDPIMQRLEATMAQDLIEQYLRGLEAKLGARVNREALGVALGDTAG